MGLPLCWEDHLPAPMSPSTPGSCVSWELASWELTAHCSELYNQEEHLIYIFLYFKHLTTTLIQTEWDWESRYVIYYLAQGHYDRIDCWWWIEWFIFLKQNVDWPCAVKCWHIFLTFLLTCIMLKKYFIFTVLRESQWNCPYLIYKMSESLGLISYSFHIHFVTFLFSVQRLSHIQTGC